MINNRGIEAVDRKIKRRIEQDPAGFPLVDGIPTATGEQSPDKRGQNYPFAIASKDVATSSLFTCTHFIPLK
jgi:hypothetical protein